MLLWIFNTILVGLLILWALMLYCNYWSRRVNRPKASPSAPPGEMTDYENPTGSESVSVSVSASCSPGIEEEIEEEDEEHPKFVAFSNLTRRKYHLEAGQTGPVYITGYAKHLEDLLYYAIEMIRENNEIKAGEKKTV